MYMLYFDHLCLLDPPATLSRFLLPKSPPAFSVAIFISCWLGYGVTCWSIDYWRKMTSLPQQTPTSDSISVRGGVSLVHLWSMLECWQTQSCAGLVQVAGCSCWEFRVRPSWCVQKALFIATPPHPPVSTSSAMVPEPSRGGINRKVSFLLFVLNSPSTLTQWEWLHWVLPIAKSSLTNVE